MAIRLPNAPLVEVVCEVNWRLESALGAPVAMDPGLAVLMDRFSKFAAGRGFVESLDMQPGYGAIGRTVKRRFTRKNAAYPILQIGSGLAACNASADYEWPTFKQLASSTLSFAIANYPTLQSFPLELEKLELRYVNVLSAEEGEDWLSTMQSQTNFRIALPPFFDSKQLRRVKRGRLFVESDVTEIDGAIFTVELASAVRDGVPVVRMTQRVTDQKCSGIPTTGAAKIRVQLEKWMSLARSVTSPAFKQFVTEQAYRRFRRA